MTNSVLRLGIAPRTRWYRVIGIVPYGVLAVLILFTALAKQGDGMSLWIDLALCALAALWMLVMYTLHPAWHERPVPMGVFVVGFIAILAVLVLRDSWFGVFAIVGYLYVFAVIPWPWQLAAVAAVAVVAGTAQASGLPKDTVLGIAGYLAIVAVNVLAICGFAWINWSRSEQSDQRRLALAEARESNRRLEATMGENAALHDRLLVQARTAGMLDERQRMAREIHDTLAQGLIGIITQLQAAEQVGQDPAERSRRVELATTLARESLSEARRSVLALGPEALETARLGDALADVAERWSALHGVPVRVTTTGTARAVPADGEAALLRTAQEALANVARHAGASRVVLTLSYLEEEVALDVRDDGAGFVPDPSRRQPAAAGGFGLVAMRQRIEGQSGTLQIESEPGNGTAISARIPSELRA